eukprot:scaffold18951_cov35-Tisochrysis_lutea.AAC.2
MPVTDYSKWERMQLEEEEEEEQRPGRPRVTRLEGPSRITLGALQQAPPTTAPPPHSSSMRLAKHSLDYSRWDKMVIDEEEESEDGESGDDAVAAAGQGFPPTSSTADPSNMSNSPSTMKTSDSHPDEREEDALDADEERRLREIICTPSSSLPQAANAQRDSFSALAARLSRNGAIQELHLWRQTRDEVEISILMPPTTRAKQVRPQLIQASDPTAALKLLVEYGGASKESPYFCKTLAYPVEQPDEDTGLAWELTDYEPASEGGRRVLRVSLRKQVPHGVIVWWTRAFQGEPEIDTLSLPDRKEARAAHAMQSVWQQAQAMFKEKVACGDTPQTAILESLQKGGTH